MNKRHLHHVWTIFRYLKPWYFLVLAVIFGLMSINALRTNNEQMVRLRDAVYSADQNDGDVSTALDNLRSFVNAHMNTTLTTPDGVYPPIQLKYTYDRLVQAESSTVNAANTQIYTQAQAYCEQQDPVDFSGHNRVPCIESYVTSHGATAQPIPDDLYKFSFASPAWSPDLAGWSLVVTALSVLLFVVTFIIDRWFKREVV